MSYGPPIGRVISDQLKDNINSRHRVSMTSRRTVLIHGNNLGSRVNDMLTGGNDLLSRVNQKRLNNS